MADANETSLARLRTGDVRRCFDAADGDAEYACVQVGSRSSLFVSRTGTLRTLYHDTGRWSKPRSARWVSNTGTLLCGARSTRLVRAIKDAWSTDEERATGRAARLADTSAALHADNVAYGRVATARERAAASRRAEAPACVRRVVQSASGADTLEQLCSECGVRPATALTYLSRGLAAMGPCFPADGFVDPDLLEAVRTTERLDGSLKDVLARLPQEVRDAWDTRRHSYEQLRLARAWVEAERRDAAEERPCGPDRHDEDAGTESTPSPVYHDASESEGR